MDNQEILEAAIRKAIKNGWEVAGVKVVGFKYHEGCYHITLYSNKDKTNSIDIPKNGLIFTHDFAKAFWGEADSSWITRNDVDAHTPGIKAAYKPYRNLKVWEYELQQMVLESEPLKYLEKFLKN